MLNATHFNAGDLAADLNAAQFNAAVVRTLIVAENAVSASSNLAQVLGAASSVLVLSSEAMAADWPDYVVARARTSGALVVEDGVEGAAFMKLEEGMLDGRPATAGVVSGALVFLLRDDGSKALDAAWAQAA